MKILVIDGQGGKMGALLVKKIKETVPECELTCVGTNALATSAMLKAGADKGATGENPVVRAADRADIIAGPRGIIAANSILGGVTPRMAEAVGGSDAQKILVPVSDCSITVAGVESMKLSDYIDDAVGRIVLLCNK